MKGFLQCFLLFSLLPFFIAKGISQQYTQRDQEEIAYQAQQTLKMYNDMLNVISYEGLANESEIRRLIRDSYTPSRSQIFYSERAIIEDNITPSRLRDRNEQDKTVKDYLKYFDLAYEKEDRATIEFYDFKPSGLKFSNHLYIQVKYTCLFKGKHKEDAAPYFAVDRLAEFRVEKRNKKWKTFISSIVYYKPENPIDSGADKVVLDNSAKQGASLSGLSEKGKIKGNVVVGSPEKRVEYLKRSAERAYASRDYTKAKEKYAEALLLKPQEENIKVQIEKLDRIIREKALLESKYAAGDYKEAIKDYNKAIRSNRGNADFYFGRGKVYEKLGNLIKAFKDYNKAIKLDRHFMEARNRRAQLFIKTGQLHQAVADYTLILSDPAYAVAFYPKRAKVKEMLGDWNGAIEDYKALMALTPGEASPYYEVGMVYFKRDNLGEAIEFFSEAIKRNPQHATAFYYRGIAYATTGKLEAASSDFERAKNIGLEKDQLIEIDKLVLQHYKKAEGAVVEKRYQRALKSFREALLLSPTFGRGWLRAGDVHFLLQDYDSAIVYYNKAVEYDPLSFAYFKRGLAYQKKEDELSAYNDFKSFIPIGKEILGRTGQERNGRPGLSLQDSFTEERADAFYALGYAQLMAHQTVDALENLNMAIHNRKFFPKAWFARGAAFYVLQDYKRAVKNMEESIKMGLSEPLVFYSLGKAYAANNQPEDALLSFSHTLKLSPKYEDAYVERAICYKSLKQYGAALDDIKTALSLNGALKKDVALLTRKGLLELYLDMFQKANHSFDQALQLNGSNAWALYGKACALALQNKTEESLEWYKRAFQTGQIEWPSIKKDPLIKPVSSQKKFKELVKIYL